MSKIIVHLSADQTVYMATHYGKRAAELKELFGTATLPTPYTGAMPAGEVVARLQALNPGACVEMQP